MAGFGLEEDIMFDVYFGDLTPEMLNNFIISEHRERLYWQFREDVLRTSISGIGVLVLLVVYFVIANVFSSYSKPYADPDLWTLPDTIGQSLKPYIDHYVNYSTPIFRTWMVYIISAIFSLWLAKRIVRRLPQLRPRVYQGTLGFDFWLWLRQCILIMINMVTAEAMLLWLWKCELIQVEHLSGEVSVAEKMQKDMDWILEKFPNVFVFLFLVHFLSEHWIVNSLRHSSVVDVAHQIGLSTFKWKAYTGCYRVLELVMFITLFGVANILLSSCQA